MQTKKVIKGDGFLLRPLVLSDAESLARHANNFKVWVNLKDGMPHPYKVSDAEWFIDHVSHDEPTQKLGIEIDGNVAGVIGITLLGDVHSKTGHLGYWLGESHWGMGHMSRVVRAFIPYVFNTFEIARIASSAYVHNTGSIRVLEKNGFVQEGVLRRHAFKNGRFVDEVLFGLLKDEYEKRR